MRNRKATVGVRELRQNLSVYLNRVKAGERLEVTERNRPVAILAPLPGGGSIIERLVASGRAIPAKGDLLALGPPRTRLRRRSGPALDATRADRL